ncbi:MAG: discoidin domain-containing protein [Pontiellaceae bacterium]|nr:discoidin domain-containing protein [Pontiellaceae bacterium]MBN2785627.1 discoidin domain-containing protein [Pontiellaceae bacterium]
MGRINKLKCCILLYGVALGLCSGHAQDNRMSLDSSNPQINWEIKPQDDVKQSGEQVSKPGYRLKDAVKGVVPGIVFTAYVDAGLEKDPNYADNIQKVDEAFYSRPFWYRTEFDMPASVKKGQRIWLNFDNVNRFADFYLNGQKISGTATSTKDVSGHMLRSRFDVTDLVNLKGKNAVAVLIYDANQKKDRDAKDQFGISASPTYLAAAGWDWMPYVPGRLAGITGNAYIEVTGDVVMRDPWIRSELEDNATAYLAFQTALKNSSGRKQTAKVRIRIQPGDIEVSKSITLEPGAISKVYMNRKEFDALVVKNPRLWWPNGYGTPDLYTCDVACEIDGQVSDRKEITFGIRKYEYRFDRNVAGWPVMSFLINGQKLFIKGGNWGMSEYLLRCHGEEYEKKIRLHKDMNYNMIRLWTGCVTDDEFYDYCDKYGIMVWDDFWIYVAYNEVENREDFKKNALDKVRRLRNHASIALWCGANETHPSPELDDYLRGIVGAEDHNDRMYKSCSNQDGLSGSGWWGNRPPKHHFESSGSNLAWNKPPYPYGSDRGYGMRSEIGTATFPVYESVIEFIPEDQQWPLPTDEQLKNEDDNVWNKHYFGKEASNASPINYKNAVNTQYGESDNLEAFCEKAQLINIEVMKGMYEAWNDKMWNDASGMLIWMSQSAYPSFVWQTYDYYYDASGAYWGAKKACEPQHIQWNSSDNSVKVINSSSDELKGVTASAVVYDLNGKAMAPYCAQAVVDVPSADRTEAFKLNFNPGNLANGKKVVASSAQGDSAALAVDGGSGSRWESDYSDPQWIYVDLGRPETIGSVVLKWEAASAASYEIQVSNDAALWRSVYSTENGDGQTDEITFNPVSARYVRMNGLKRATAYGYSIFEFEVYGADSKAAELTPLHFINLELKDSAGNLISENFYWRNGVNDLDYTELNKLPKANVAVKVVKKEQVGDKGRIELVVANASSTVAFANRLRLMNKTTQERVLPVIMNDNYITLMPGQKKTITMEADMSMLQGDISLLLKQYKQDEEAATSFRLK